MILNEPTRSWLSRLSDIGRPAHEDIEAERRARVADSDLLSAEFSQPVRGDVAIRDHRVGQDAIPVYEVRKSDAGETPPAAYVFLHGGAFWHGSATEKVNMALAATRAAVAEVAVFVVEYRLAPEHPCPSAIEDTVAVLRWLRKEADALGIDASRLVLGGVSAGASIAASAVGRVKADGLVTGLLLEVPAIDLRPDGSWDERYAAVNGLDSSARMVDLYANGLPAHHPEISPTLIDVSGFPPTHIMTAEYDPLRDGGEILAARLRESGVKVTATRHLGALHGSLGLTAVDPIAAAWQDEACCALRRLSMEGSHDR